MTIRETIAAEIEELRVEARAISSSLRDDAGEDECARVVAQHDKVCVRIERLQDALREARAIDAGRAAPMAASTPATTPTAPTLSPPSRFYPSACGDTSWVRTRD